MLCTSPLFFGGKSVSALHLCLLSLWALWEILLFLLMLFLHRHIGGMNVVPPPPPNCACSVPTVLLHSFIIYSQRKWYLWSFCFVTSRFRKLFLFFPSFNHLTMKWKFIFYIVLVVFLAILYYISTNALFLYVFTCFNLKTKTKEGKTVAWFLCTLKFSW